MGYAGGIGMKSRDEVRKAKLGGSGGLERQMNRRVGLRKYGP